MTKRKDKAKPEAAPARPKQPGIATWLRTMADAADDGRLVGLAAAVMLTDAAVPLTSIADPTGLERMTLAGTVAQLHHMLQATEQHERMTALANRSNPGPQT